MASETPRPPSFVVVIGDEDRDRLDALKDRRETIQPHILEAHDVDDAVRRISASEPDLVAVPEDVEGRSHLELCRRVKHSNPGLCTLVVLENLTDIPPDDPNVDDYVALGSSDEMMARINVLLNLKAYNTRAAPIRERVLEAFRAFDLDPALLDDGRLVPPSKVAQREVVDMDLIHDLEAAISRLADTAFTCYRYAAEPDAVMSSGREGCPRGHCPVAHAVNRGPGFPVAVEECDVDAWVCARDAMVRGELNDTLCPGGYRVVGVPVDLRFRGVRYPLLGITVALPAAINTERLTQLAQRANVDPEELRREVERSPLPHLSSVHVSALLRIQQNVTEAVSRDVSQEYATAYNVLVEAVERWENNRALTRRSLQLQHANERLREMNRLKNEFLANVSHELKTPMTSVIGFTSLLLRGGGGELPQKAEHYLNRALANARSLHAAINDILDLAHLDSRDVCLSPDTFSLPDLVEDALDEVGPLLDKKPIEMRLEVGEDCAELNTDRERLRQVVVSLLRNAAKFTHRGHITVSAALHEGEVCPWVSIAVSDTGVGLPSEALPHIFEEFRQVDGSSTRAHSGTGLGLALVRRLAGLLGGEVAVKSQLDEGSTFTISIPSDLPSYQERQEELRELVRSAEPDRLDRSTPIVLTVGVDPQRALEIREWCDAQNYRVATSFDMEDALEQAREVRPCAILLRVLVPGQDVWELTDELRADPLTTDVPLIVSSDFGGPELAEAVDAADFLPRDFTADGLLNALDALRTVRTGLVLAIVKDDAVRGSLRRALRKAGYGVRACAAFADACHFAHESLDAIVLDPRANGEQAISALGRIRSGAWANVPVVAIVPPEASDEERRGLDAHVDEVVEPGAEIPGAVVDAVARVREQSSSREAPPTRE